MERTAGHDHEQALGLVGIALYPHLNRTDMPPLLAEMEAWASDLPVPAYAIDCDTAIKVVDGEVEVISESTWKLLNPPGRSVDPSIRGQESMNSGGHIRSLRIGKPPETRRFSRWS